MVKQDFNFRFSNSRLKILNSIFQEAQQTRIPKQARRLSLGVPLKVNPIGRRRRGFTWRNLKLLKPPRNLMFPEVGYIN